jgi:hypothetical protein
MQILLINRDREGEGKEYALTETGGSSMRYYIGLVMLPPPT